MSKIISFSGQGNLPGSISRYFLWQPWHVVELVPLTYTKCHGVIKFITNSVNRFWWKIENMKKEFYLVLYWFLVFVLPSHEAVGLSLKWSSIALLPNIIFQDSCIWKWLIYLREESFREIFDWINDNVKETIIMNI